VRVQFADEVSQLHAKLQRRDIEFANMSKNLERIEQQESKLRADSAADVQSVRQQINEMRQALNDSRQSTFPQQ
jgi:septal ring factor EnvC (AmiA/AmiB activator)